MSISPIPNQPIRLQVDGPTDDCNCIGQPFCQLVEKADATQFEIVSPDLVQNGNFDTDLSEWDVRSTISVGVTTENESETDACDGSVEVVLVFPEELGPYTYSIDNGLTFQSGSVFEDLCAGDYIIIAKNELGYTGHTTFTIETD